MSKLISFDNLKSQVNKSKDKIIILSTDEDNRFKKAKDILEREFQNLEYRIVNKKYIQDFEKGKKEKLFNLYKDIRKGKESEEQLEKNFLDPNYFANLMLKAGFAHGIVSGATHPTADILRPGFQILKTKSAGSPVSSFMWLHKKDERDLFFADISVNPNPSSKELSEIAIQTADSVKDVFNIEPIIAMLSFSTIGSGGKHPMVLKVKEATDLVKENGKYQVIGEIQWDAAFKKDIFDLKVKNVELKEMPNVFIFPDLDAGNIGYKIASSVGGYKAVGPLLQNISMPLNDLSRGANVEEIVELVILTALQVISNKK